MFRFVDYNVWWWLRDVSVFSIRWSGDGRRDGFESFIAIVVVVVILVEDGSNGREEGTDAVGDGHAFMVVVVLIVKGLGVCLGLFVDFIVGGCGCVA